MATPIEIENKIKDEESSIDSWFKKIAFISLVVFVICLIFLFFSYTWKYPIFKWQYPIDAARWGQFGDFFGGVLGTIITFTSIIFLYKAFKEQRLANIATQEANKEILRKEEIHVYSERMQQFDSMFKTIFSLYQTAVTRYKTDRLNAGKVSLAYMVTSFIKDTQFSNNENYTKRTVAAKNIFTNFIAENQSLINAHMGLLYQLLLLLESSPINEKDKIIYAKTIRSQLTEEELILIRYNCMNKRGMKMQPLVFHYNILKHLPIMNLFEFKKYRTNLTEREINTLNNEFIQLRKEIHSLFLENRQNLNLEYTKTCNISINTTNSNKQYEFKLTKASSIQGRIYNTFISVINKFDSQNLECLIWDFHVELFRHSHFHIYNRSLNIVHSYERKDSTETFTINITNRQPIILSFFQIQDPSPETN